MSSDLRVALNPASIAVIGASDNPNKIGGRPLLYLSKFGYRGQIFPVNPTRTEVQGRKCFPDLSALPVCPEMAIVAVAGEAAERAVADCAACGIKVAVVMASGFSESDPVRGKQAEQNMRTAARTAGMRIIGPNTQGLANFATGTIANFSTMFIEVPPLDGPVAIVSQSGAMSVVPYGFLRRRGIGVRHAHATGNQCDVTVAELAAAVVTDPAVRLLLLYFEGIADPENLAAVAAIARARGLPIIAVKSGRTPAGQAAARSHTGALANEDRVVDAFFEAHGIWRADDVEALIEAAELYLKGEWRPQGRRLVVISNSGAVCVMAADAASKVEMPLASFASDTRAQLERVLPSFATAGNPVDLTAALLSNSKLFRDILPVIARDPAADAFLISVAVAGTGYDIDAIASDAAEFGQRTAKPLVIAAPQPSIAEHFAAQGLPTFPTETRAINALHQFLSHYELMQRTRQANPEPSCGGVWSGTPEGQLALNEAESLAIIAGTGIAVAPHRLCHSAEECVWAWRELGGPVVLKACSRELLHKSDLDLVRLKLNTEESIVATFHELSATMQEHQLIRGCDRCGDGGRFARTDVGCSPRPGVRSGGRGRGWWKVR